ncbi:hypothetical protein, partial [Nocardiopsis oceani]
NHSSRTSARTLALAALPWKASAFPLVVFFTLSGVPHPAKSAVSVLNLIELKKLVLLLSPCVSARRLKQLSELTCSGQCPNHLG